MTRVTIRGIRSEILGIVVKIFQREIEGVSLRGIHIHRDNASQLTDLLVVSPPQLCLTGVDPKDMKKVVMKANRDLQKYLRPEDFTFECPDDETAVLVRLIA